MLQLKKKVRRLIRYNCVYERAQQIVRQSSTLELEQIGLRIEVKHDDVLVDCGANVGDVTSAFARTGTNLRIEPSAASFAVLRPLCRLAQRHHF